MVASKLCRKPWWHPKGTCEDTEKIVASQFKKMDSDLFKIKGRVPAAQNEIMNRNASVSPLLRLPPEIRIRIFKFVLGGQQIWIGHYPSYSNNFDPSHYGGAFYHLNTADGTGRGLDIRLLRVCRQVFMETSLLPYALNHFSFVSTSVRQEFERLVRPGKKKVQKKAIGAYDVCDFITFRARLESLMPKTETKTSKRLLCLPM